MSFGCERSCSSPRRVLNFNSNVPHGIHFERDPLNIFRVRTSSGSMGGSGGGGGGGGGGGSGDAKTTISPNISFGDITSQYISLFVLSVVYKNENS